MNAKLLSIIGLCSIILSFQSPRSYEMKEFPIKLLKGYGTVPAGFIRLKELGGTDDLMHEAIRQNITGIPKNWTSISIKFILFEPNQFVFQSYKQGLVSEEYFNDFKKRRYANFEKRPLSEEPIKCLVYVLYGRDEKGIWKHKVDANNNYNFADDSEILPPKVDWTKLDSLAKEYSFEVKYESFRNGKIVELSAPVLIVDLDNGFFGVNIPQHGETEIDGTKILISSQGFTTTDYDSVSVYNLNRIDERINEKEYITIGSHAYRNLGCNINKMVLQLEKLD
ncbi:MAG TPA: hypothetical protein PKM03_07225 [Cyclobacteriaceae bacterium]|nr:hypothetical protein [Cyclobacteriaceae bacterium]